MHHIDFAEALFCDRAFEQLQCSVEAVLFHDKQAFARFISGFDHALTVSKTGCHRFFGDDVKTRFQRLNRLFGMQTGRRGDDDYVGIGFRQHFRIAGIALRPGAFDRRFKRGRIDVAHGNEFAIFLQYFKRAKMVVGNTAAAD